MCGSFVIIWRNFNFRIEDLKDYINKVEDKMDRLEVKTEQTEKDTNDIVVHIHSKIDKVFDCVNKLNVTQAAMISNLGETFVSKDVCTEKHKIV